MHKLYFLQRQIHIHLKLPVIPEFAPKLLHMYAEKKKKRVHICAQHEAAQHTQIYTQTRFTSLTQMSGFLVAFRGIKSISAQVTAILQKPA